MWVGKGFNSIEFSLLSRGNRERLNRSWKNHSWNRKEAGWISFRMIKLKGIDERISVYE